MIFLAEYIADVIEQVEAEEYMTDSDTVNSSGDNSGNDTGTNTPPFYIAAPFVLFFSNFFIF